MEKECKASVRKHVAELSTEGLKSKREVNTVMYLRSKMLEFGYDLFDAKRASYKTMNTYFRVYYRLPK